MIGNEEWKGNSGLRKECGQSCVKDETGKTEKRNTLNAAIDNMSKRTRDLRRQLRKAIVDHISDSFLDTAVPLLVLIEAAKNGREKEIREYAAIFHEHTGRLVEILAFIKVTTCLDVSVIVSESSGLWENHFNAPAILQAPLSHDYPDFSHADALSQNKHPSDTLWGAFLAVKEES
ncbi:hypothetical protein STEG23_008094, partial [Scotinomys teguina]